jgi:hypothetical protein
MADQYFVDISDDNFILSTLPFFPKDFPWNSSQNGLTYSTNTYSPFLD